MTRSAIALMCVGLFAGELFTVPVVLSQDAAPPIKDRPIEKLRLRATAHGENTQLYRIDVYDPSDSEYDGWLLEIRCTNCKQEYVYREIVDDIPSSIFPITPKQNYLVTEWSTAVAKIIRLYYLGAEVRLVMETGGRGVAQFTLSEDYQYPVVTMVRRDEDRLETYHREIWRWDGTGFVSTTQCIENCEP